MKAKPQFQLHPNESISGTITRLYKRVRTLRGSHQLHQPASHYASGLASKRAMKPKLRLVK